MTSRERPRRAGATRILFTGGGGAGTEALFRMLDGRYEVHAADADRDAIDPTIPVDRRHTIPWASDSSFVGSVTDLCRRLAIEVLVPGVDEELLPLARALERIAPTRVLQPSAEYTETMLDKLTMIQALAKHHLPVPASRTLADDLGGVQFPCIAKPRHGRGSRGVRTIESRAVAEELRTSLGDGAEEVLIQQLAAGTEYTVQMLASADAVLHAIVPVLVEVKRGITIRARTDADPQVMAACQAIHASLPAAGCYNVQLMLTPAGDVVPFEINPRISTTFCMTVAAGIDPIAVFLGQITASGLLSFPVGLTLRRNWTNHFSRAGDVGN